MKIRDPITLLSARELAQELGSVTESEVLRLKKNLKLFEVTIVSRSERRTGYPIFQAWAGIAGKPLEAVLAVFRGHRVDASSEAYAFFIGVNELFGGLTPIEVLLGTLLRTRPLSSSIEDLLHAPAEERLDMVVQAARAAMASEAP